MTHLVQYTHIGEVMMIHLVQHRDNNAPCIALTSKMTMTHSVQYIFIDDDTTCTVLTGRVTIHHNIQSSVDR